VGLFRVRSSGDDRRYDDCCAPAAAAVAPVGPDLSGRFSPGSAESVQTSLDPQRRRPGRRPSNSPQAAAFGGPPSRRPLWLSAGARPALRRRGLPA
jgi:hypothetical protein